jgi:hypothetical protein
VLEYSNQEPTFEERDGSFSLTPSGKEWLRRIAMVLQGKTFFHPLVFAVHSVHQAGEREESQARAIYEFLNQNGVAGVKIKLENRNEPLRIKTQPDSSLIVSSHPAISSAENGFVLGVGEKPSRSAGVSWETWNHLDREVRSPETLVNRFRAAVRGLLTEAQITPFTVENITLESTNVPDRSENGSFEQSHFLKVRVVPQGSKPPLVISIRVAELSKPRLTAYLWTEARSWAVEWSFAQQTGGR